MKRLILFVLILNVIQLKAQQTIPLYNGEIPNSVHYVMKEIKMENHCWCVKN